MAAADWTGRFSGLAALSDDDRALLARGSSEQRIATGTRLFQPGTPCGAYLFVIEGAVRVQMIADTGREMLLYRVRPGETCILTTACLLGDDSYPAEGVVESELVGVAVPLVLFRTLLARSEPFRGFVFHGFGRRIADLLATIQDTVFHRIDGRLARSLVERGGSGVVDATHQDLAAELGSAREVVSRHLAAFERDGLVELHRGAIRILQPSRLRERAGQID